MKQSRRNRRNAALAAEKRSTGKPAVSKYEAKSRAQDPAPAAAPKSGGVVAAG